MRNKYYQYEEPPVDLKPFLNNSLLSRLADFTYRTFFQPIQNLADKFSARWTRRFCQDRIPANERQ